MTTMPINGSGDDIAQLRAEIAELRAAQGPKAKNGRRTWRRPLALVAVAVLTVAALAGVAGASGSTTDVTFTPLSPAKALLTNTAIATKKTSSPVVIGGTTTVPSNATTVELSVSVKGPSIGTLDFYPAMNPNGGSGQTVSYPGSNVVNTGTVEENVGQAGEITIYNNGIGTATVTVKILGYSTQVTAGDINGVGGTAGQVLTNDGNGGAAWQTPGQEFINAGGYMTVPEYPTVTTVKSLTVPAGTYHVLATFNANSSVNDFLICHLNAPDGYSSSYTYTALSAPYIGEYWGGGSAQMVITTSGGSIQLNCYDVNTSSGAYIQNETLTATAVGNASGNGVIN